MQLNKFVVAMMFAGAFVATNVNAADGEITFTGGITAGACNIDASSTRQTVELGDITISNLTTGDKETMRRDFDIKLYGCELAASPATNQVKVRFEGSAASSTVEGRQLFGLSNTTARGAGIAIYGPNFERIAPNSSSDAIDFIDGNNTLRFQASIKSDDSAASEVRVGRFSSLVQFNLSYL